MLRIGLLFCALAAGAFLSARWTSNHPQHVREMGFGFAETFSPDEAQTDALRAALARPPDDRVAREKPR